VYFVPDLGVYGRHTTVTKVVSVLRFSCAAFVQVDGLSISKPLIR
jgi:hypothetical protein